MGDFGADPALVASQSSQSPLSRPSGFDPGEFNPDEYGPTCAMVTLRMEQLMDDSLFQIIHRLCALEMALKQARNGQ